MIVGKDVVIKCAALINLSAPVRTEKVRGYQPPWRTVYVYVCPQCGGETKVRANSFIGKNPQPSRGAIVCGRPVI